MGRVWRQAVRCARVWRQGLKGIQLVRSGLSKKKNITNLYSSELFQLNTTFPFSYPSFSTSILLTIWYRIRSILAVADLELVPPCHGYFTRSQRRHAFMDDNTKPILDEMEKEDFGAGRQVGAAVLGDGDHQGGTLGGVGDLGYRAGSLATEGGRCHRRRQA